MSTELYIKVDNRKTVKAEMDKQILKALESCGLVAEGYAKTNITRQRAVDTGALRNSMSHEVTKEDGKQVCYIGSNLEYAPYVEFGTGVHVTGGRRTPWVYKDRNGWHKTSGMVSRPYLKPAITEHIDQYKNIIESTLKE